MTVDEVDDLLSRLSTGSCHQDVIRGILTAWKPLNDPRKDAKLLVTIFGAEEGQVLAHMLREQHENFSSIVLETLEHWTALLRPHFEDPQRQTPSTSMLVRQQLAGVAPIEAVALWDNEMAWRNNPRIVRALIYLIEALSANSIVKFEHASKLVPFVVHVAEDCSPIHRTHGVLAIRGFLQAVTDRIILQMQLDELFFSILLKNLTFDDLELKSESISLLGGRLLPMFFATKRERALEHSSRLLEFLVKEASFAHDMRLCSLYLDAIIVVVSPLSVSLVCHLTILLPLVADMLDNEQLKFDRRIVTLLKAILATCWPRLHAHSMLLSLIHKKLIAAGLGDANLIERIKLFCG